MDFGKHSHPIWLVTPMIVITDSTTPKDATRMGMTKTKNGITNAPDNASHGWKDMAAHAVGGRLS